MGLNKVESFFKSAQDNWPEDEAYSLLCGHQENIEAEIELETIAGDLHYDIMNMIEVFNMESDNKELITRFEKYLAIN